MWKSIRVGQEATLSTIVFTRQVDRAQLVLLERSAIQTNFVPRNKIVWAINHASPLPFGRIVMVALSINQLGHMAYCIILKSLYS
ncbi:hypothetical protein TELCIR_06033 [Teladorsagia circumcincta]|uniref:Uncharacterized protein n=1 Tax=Teladorsagia circumcincta TaxID=45464 RepID=A0A2G9UQR6_TELCI|nr:hypothetical protein TELCIR_06033 [Teladorsagia circumcincta]